MDATTLLNSAESAAAVAAAAERYPIALWSDKSREEVVASLTLARLPIEAFVGMNPEQFGTPNETPTDRLNRLISVLPRPVKRVFMISDQVKTIEACIERKTKLKTEVLPLGLLGPDATPDQLEDAGAAFTIRDLSEGVTLVDAFSSSISSLSIVLLAYNEEALIRSAIEDARRFCQLLGCDYEIIVVDDGSSDRTRDEIEKARKPDLRLVAHETNLGMGASMRDGYAAATKDFLVHLPGDRQVRPQALATFLPHASGDVIVISEYDEPPSGWKRAVMSSVFRLLLRNVGALRVTLRAPISSTEAG